MSACTSWPGRVVERLRRPVWPLACARDRREALASMHASQLIFGHLASTLGASCVQPGNRRRMGLPRWSRLCIARPASAALRMPICECELAPRIADVAMAPPGCAPATGMERILAYAFPIAATSHRYRPSAHRSNGMYKSSRPLSPLALPGSTKQRVLRKMVSTSLSSHSCPTESIGRVNSGTHRTLRMTTRRRSPAALR